MIKALDPELVPPSRLHCYAITAFGSSSPSPLAASAAGLEIHDIFGNFTRSQTHHFPSFLPQCSPFTPLLLWHILTSAPCLASWSASHVSLHVLQFVCAVLTSLLGFTDFTSSIIPHICSSPKLDPTLKMASPGSSIDRNDEGDWSESEFAEPTEAQKAEQAEKAKQWQRKMIGYKDEEPANTPTPKKAIPPRATSSAKAKSQQREPASAKGHKNGRGIVEEVPSYHRTAVPPSQESSNKSQGNPLSPESNSDSLKTASVSPEAPQPTPKRTIAIQRSKTVKETSTQEDVALGPDDGSMEAFIPSDLDDAQPVKRKRKPKGAGKPPRVANTAYMHPLQGPAPNGAKLVMPNAEDSSSETESVDDTSKEPVSAMTPVADAVNKLDNETKRVEDTIKKAGPGLYWPVSRSFPATNAQKPRPIGQKTIGNAPTNEYAATRSPDHGHTTSYSSSMIVLKEGQMAMKESAVVLQAGVAKEKGPKLGLAAQVEKNEAYSLGKKTQAASPRKINTPRKLHPVINSPGIKLSTMTSQRKRPSPKKSNDTPPHPTKVLKANRKRTLDEMSVGTLFEPSQIVCKRQRQGTQNQKKPHGKMSTPVEALADTLEDETIYIDDAAVLEPVEGKSQENSFSEANVAATTIEDTEEGSKAADNEIFIDSSGKPAATEDAEEGSKAAELVEIVIDSSNESTIIAKTLVIGPSTGHRSSYQQDPPTTPPPEGFVKVVDPIAEAPGAPKDATVRHTTSRKTASGETIAALEAAAESYKTTNKATVTKPSISHNKGGEEILYHYLVTLQYSGPNVPTAKGIKTTFGPYYTRDEANVIAREESSRPHEAIATIDSKVDLGRTDEKGHSYSVVADELGLQTSTLTVGGRTTVASVSRGQSNLS